MYQQALSRFNDLTHILSKYRSYWQLIPFDYLDLPWHAENPKLWTWLNTQTREDILTHDSLDGRLSDILAPFLPEIKAFKRLIDLPSLVGHKTTYAPSLNRYVPGRKWAQIKAFADTIPVSQNRILEWCAGKGHLGRLLSSTYEIPVISLDRDESLCDAGRVLARKVQAPMTFHSIDIRTPATAKYIHRDQHAVALHACGDLHTTLLRLAIEKQCAAISIAPCCYHAIGGQVYQPLSSMGVKSDLHLRRFDLKLPVQEQVTASLRVQRLREVQLHWRLAFDLYQRDVTGCRTYQHVPTVQEGLLKTDLKSLFAWAASKCNLPISGSVDYQTYELRAKARRIIISRIELIRHIFRRPLEIWLIMDRALYLMEHGYDVTVGEFCPKPVTPRNMLIHAQKSA